MLAERAYAPAAVSWRASASAAADAGSLAIWIEPLKGALAWISDWEISVRDSGLVAVFGVAYKSQKFPSASAILYLITEGRPAGEGRRLKLWKNTPLPSTGVAELYSAVTNPMPCTRGKLIKGTVLLGEESRFTDTENELWELVLRRDVEGGSSVQERRREVIPMGERK
jgi:hypothetical protein